MVVSRSLAGPVDLAQCSRAELLALLPQIGGTPLVPVKVLIPEARWILLKLEGANPGGSLKDRIARFMIDQLRGRQQLPRGATLVDSTSGNFGIALAWLARAQGFRFIAVSDPKLTSENAQRLKDLDAHVEIVQERDTAGGWLLTRIGRAREIAQTEGAVWVNQYSNRDNPRAHYLETGPELLRQVTPPLQAVFVPASTGGTLAGLGAFLKRHSPQTRVIAVDGEGSSLFGGCLGPRAVNGLGSSRRSEFLSLDLYDDVVRVGGQEAFDYCRDLRRSTGIEVGGSAGAAVAACVAYLQLHSEISTAVCICPDHGANYRSSIFNDEWMKQQGYETRSATLVAS
ncbi:MAG TPA: pyridoxal-phosphate dependent enzyme [Candidatus Dormibacteraeota bacterium]|nr:pyridoxal-phosphate dependent enzyme [Candidatus Dormibacteraeota bacterium]